MWACSLRFCICSLRVCPVKVCICCCTLAGVVRRCHNKSFANFFNMRLSQDYSTEFGRLGATSPGHSVSLLGNAMRTVHALVEF